MTVLCYLCNKKMGVTKDHIPPKNLFIKPLPSNLITVDACEECHKKYTLDDEAFRIFASSVIGRSKEGNLIWQNKVIGSSFQRSPKLKENVTKSIVTLINKEANTVEYGLTFSIKRASNYLIRITKGLIKHFHPELDYSKSTFKVIMQNQKANKNLIKNMLYKFPYDERGNGIFRFWRAFPYSNKPASFWTYLFYDGIMFSVFVDKDKI